MKVSELTGAKLDYWAGKANGLTTFTNGSTCFLDARVHGRTEQRCTPYSPSTDWSQGGPIIGREGIELKKDRRHSNLARIGGFEPDLVMPGKTPLEAAMRCFVASKFGEDVTDE